MACGFDAEFDKRHIQTHTPYSFLNLRVSFVKKHDRKKR